MTQLVLYQTVHLFRGQARNLAAHATLLDAASRACFFRPYAPDLNRLAARIASAARAEHYPDEVSCFVRLELTPEGEERLLPAGASLYAGYALRTLMPEAVTVAYEPPFGEAPSTVREAAALLTQQQALHAGAEIAVCCDRNGVLRSADDAPLFGIRRRELIPGPDYPSVERPLVLRAARAAGIAVSDDRLTRSLMLHLDELFYADHRGLTALSRCDDLPLMALLTERIAGTMERLFPQT